MSEEPLEEQTKEEPPKKSRKKGFLEINEIDQEEKITLANRLIAAGALLVAYVPTVILGGWWWFAITAITLLIATYEFISAPHKKYPIILYIATYLIVLGYAYWFFIKNNVQAYQDDPDGWSFALETMYSGLFISIYGLIASMGVYCLASVIFHHKGFKWDDACYLFVLSLIVGLGFQAFMFCRYLPYEISDTTAVLSDDSFNYFGSAVFIIFVIMGACFNDAFAYFTGMLFGKHKLCPSVSPNKSVEGFFGGWILGGSVTFGFAMIVDACGYPILETMRIFGDGSQWWYPLILAFTLPLVGDLGDLTFSIIKRHYGFKDYGFILGSMGGALDRLDSILFCTIYAATFAVFTWHSWDFFV